MKFQDLYEKENKEHSAVSPGVQTLPVDQYMGAYKFSKDVAGHDGKKQHSPDASGSKVYTDKAIVVGYTDLEDKMTNAVLPKTKQTVAAGSEEPATVQKNSPLSKKSVKEAYQNDEANVFYKYDTADGKLKQRMVQNLDEPRARSAGYKETQEQALKAAGIMRSKFDPKKFVQNQNGKWVTVYPYGQQGVAEGAPELLKKEMPLHRHAEKLLAQNGVSKDDPDYYHHLGNTIKHLRQFGNIDLINKQGVAEGESNREIWDRVRSKGVVPGIDREKYTERPGLEGPFHTKSGKVVYYDKQEGKYYDPSTDFYISHDDYQAMNEQGVAEEIIGQPEFDHTDNAGRGSYSAAEYTATSKHRLGSHVYEVTTEQDGDGDFYYFIYENGKEIFSSSQPSNKNQLGDRISSALLDEHKKATAHLFDSDDEDDDYDAKKGVAEDLDADQKRVGQLGPTEKVKNNNIGKLVGANENFINTVDQAVVSEEDEMAESILSAIKKVGKKVLDTVAPGDEQLLKQLDIDVHDGKVPNRYNSDAESAKKDPADSWKAKVDESSDELARILTIMNHRR